MSRLFLPLLAVCAAALPATGRTEEAWKPLFNGRDLSGWIPKVNHHPLGENWRDTFRVEDGVLRVAYDKYGQFTDEFAHLIHRTPYSSYRLRLEYRFVGEPTPGAPAWAIRNSGVMIHGQAPETMSRDQAFPISVEAQFLGAAPGETRTTGNLCTPGVSVVVAGERMKEHCRNSAHPAYPDGEWVRFEVEVRGARTVRQIVNGQTVFEYGDLKLAPAEYDWLKLDKAAPEAAAIVAQGEAPLDGGYISLQGEGHPIEFRKIEILELAD